MSALCFPVPVVLVVLLLYGSVDKLSVVGVLTLSTVLKSNGYVAVELTRAVVVRHNSNSSSAVAGGGGEDNLDKKNGDAVVAADTVVVATSALVSLSNGTDDSTDGLDIGGGDVTTASLSVELTRLASWEARVRRVAASTTTCTTSCSSSSISLLRSQ
jgi:hypothetical protein